MQLFRNMEVILMLAFGIVCATFAFRPTGPGDTAPGHQAAALAATAAYAAHLAAGMPTPVVHVIGRRLSADERHGVVRSVD